MNPTHFSATESIHISLILRLFFPPIKNPFLILTSHLSFDRYPLSNLCAFFWSMLMPPPFYVHCSPHPSPNPRRSWSIVIVILSSVVFAQAHEHICMRNTVRLCRGPGPPHRSHKASARFLLPLRNRCLFTNRSDRFPGVFARRGKVAFFSRRIWTYVKSEPQSAPGLVFAAISNSIWISWCHRKICIICRFASHNLVHTHSVLRPMKVERVVRFAFEPKDDTAV